MLLNRLIIIFMIVALHDAMPCSSKLKTWPEYLQNFKEIILNSYEMLLQEWNIFKETHGKKYKTDEEDIKRMNIFAHNKLFIAKHNDLYEKGVVTFTVKMNKFGDMTANEFIAHYGINNIILEEKDNNREKIKFMQSAVVTLPEEKDWRKEGAVTKVKDQGRCGSSWAFSTTGALEGYYFVKNYYLLELSEQNIIDCSTNLVNRGCLGGRPREAFEYVKRNRGIDSEQSYPYKSIQGRCRYNSTYSIPSAEWYYTVSPYEDHLQRMVAEYRTVSVIVDISDPTFQFYEKGVYFSKKCSSNAKNLNHAMLLVGYGAADYGGEYWLVKNSWAKDWGEEGYVRMARNRDNNCGIASEAILPW